MKNWTTWSFALVLAATFVACKSVDESLLSAPTSSGKGGAGGTTSGGAGGSSGGDAGGSGGASGSSGAGGTGGDSGAGGTSSGGAGGSTGGTGSCTADTEVCDDEDNDCDGKIDEGGDVACEAERPNANSQCVRGLCVPRGCKTGFVDCDGLPQNGCESCSSAVCANDSRCASSPDDAGADDSGS